MARYTFTLEADEREALTRLIRTGRASARRIVHGLILLQPWSVWMRRASKGSTSSTPSTFAGIAANAALALVAVACSLLDRQLAAQAAAFRQDGGFTERFYRVRSAERKRSP